MRGLVKEGQRIRASGPSAVKAPIFGVAISNGEMHAVNGWALAWPRGYACGDGWEEGAEEYVYSHAFFVGAGRRDRRVDLRRSPQVLMECRGLRMTRRGVGPREVEWAR